jgi:hypothetical protein
MISSLELCQIIESSFLPARCQCSVDARGLMSIQLYTSHTGHADFMATGIEVSTLNTSRSIASLITGLKEDLRLRSLNSDWAQGIDSRSTSYGR